MENQFSEQKEKVRLETFIDAILAIILTILVLEFKIPENPFSSNQQLRSFLQHLLPSLLSYGISFTTIIFLWIDHHLLFHLIRKADVKFTLLNFVFILFLSPVPFTTALAGRNYENSYAVALVGTNYFLMGLSFSFLWRYAVVNKLLPEDKMKERFFKRDVIVSIGGSCLLLLSIPLAFVSTTLTFVLFVIVILGHVLKQFVR